jgi:hypothetical protein
MYKKMLFLYRGLILCGSQKMFTKNQSFGYSNNNDNHNFSIIIYNNNNNNNNNNNIIIIIIITHFAKRCVVLILTNIRSFDGLIFISSSF